MQISKTSPATLQKQHRFTFIQKLSNAASFPVLNKRPYGKINHKRLTCLSVHILISAILPTLGLELFYISVPRKNASIPNRPDINIATVTSITTRRTAEFSKFFVQPPDNAVAAAASLHMDSQF